MAVTPRSVPSILTSPSNGLDTNIPNGQVDVVANQPFISDSMLNKVAIDSSTYPNARSDIVGFGKGKRILVNYYRRMRSGGSNDRSNAADYPTVRNVLNQEYEKIVNLEITLKAGLEFTTNPEHAYVNMTGEAMFYPFMNPSVGDIFTFGLGDGRVGVFQLTQVDPGTWRSLKIFSVKFTIQSFMDDSDAAALEGSVGRTYVFSKANYLGGTASLLSEVTYLQLEQIKAMRGSLAKYYHETFYDQEICSYLRPDGNYDPYLTQYMCNKITHDEVHIRPKNLTGQNVIAYKASIWARLEDRFNTTLHGVKGGFEIVPYAQTRMGQFVAELNGNGIISLFSDLEQHSPYVFTTNFYNGIDADMTAFEAVIYRAITQRDCGDLGTLIDTYLNNAWSLPPDQQFYHIPLYLHLIDMAKQNKYREIDAPSMNYASTGG